jgi:hypothetical protein
MYASIGPSNDMPYTTVAVSLTAQTGTIVPSVTGQIIRAYGLLLTAGGTTTVTIQDSVGTFTGGMTLTATGAILTLAPTGAPWFITAPGASFQIVNSASTLTGILYYTQNKFQG